MASEQEQEIERIRSRLDAVATIDGPVYAGDYEEPEVADVGGDERDVIADLRTLLAALDDATSELEETRKLLDEGRTLLFRAEDGERALRAEQVRLRAVVEAARAVCAPLKGRYRDERWMELTHGRQQLSDALDALDREEPDGDA